MRCVALRPALQPHAKLSRFVRDSARERIIRVLFNVCADEDNYNAQSLNAREIALRLPANQFSSALFFEKNADQRLLRPGIRLVKLPSQRRTGRLGRGSVMGAV